MTVTTSRRFLTVFFISLGLMVPIPAFPASPDFFESLRNDRDTEPSRPDPQRTDTGPIPSLRQTPSDIDESGEPDRSNRVPPSPEVRSSRDRDRSGTSVRVVIPPSNATLRLSDPHAEPSLRRTPSPKSASDTGVWYSRQGRSFENTLFFGMRWPGLSVGLRESPYTLEVKYLEESDDVKITGLRLYHHLLRVDATNVYWGLDLARVSFEGDVSEGTGNSTGLYAGFEKRLWGPFSWSLDLGPYYIHLRDDATNIKADGLEFTLTTGINVGFL